MTELAPAEDASFGDWVRKQRIQRGLSQVQLAEESGLSQAAISFIETGRNQNPTEGLRARLLRALAPVRHDETVTAETEAAEAREVQVGTARAEQEAIQVQIPGIGSLESFDPHVLDTVPEGPGVYVFYDVSDRPIYVGRSKRVRSRVRTHQDRFWFKPPIVTTAYYLRVEDDVLRSQIEKTLIQFLKTNAVVNQVYVDRDAEEAD